MRNLDVVNWPFMRPSKVALWGPILPILAGTFGWVLASESSSVSMVANPLAILSCAVILTACLCILVPILFKWDWRAEYFGVSFLYIGSISLMFLIPVFCLIFYGGLQQWVRLLIFFIYIAFHLKWCNRFIVYYRNIYLERELFSLLYAEEDDAVYYMQKVDVYFFNQLTPFRQMPSDLFVMICFSLSLVLVIFMGFIRAATGLPFIYTFMAVSGLPISLMCLGLATRGWLLFYFYPWKIRSVAGKSVYVDMESSPDKFEGRIRCWKRRSQK